MILSLSVEVVAGSSAGYTSAKNGFSTLIIDKAIRLGGSATNALVTPMMRSFTNHHQNFYDLENEMKKYGETRDQHGTAQRWFSAEAMQMRGKSYTAVV